MATIGKLAAGVLCLFAFGLLLPLTVAVLDGDRRTAETLLLVMMAQCFLSSIGLTALNRLQQRPDRMGVFRAGAVLWVVLVAAAAPAFMLAEGQTFVAALFEATSAVTSMGLTVRPPEDIVPAMAFYRASVAWMGGFAALGCAVYILAPYRVGGTPDTHLRLIQHARTDEPRLSATFRAVALPYAGLTAACALLLLILRVSPQDALIAAMSTLATNGFMPATDGDSVLGNRAAEVVLMVFMVAGATSIVWHRMLLVRRGFPSRERSEAVLFLLAVVAFGTLAAIGTVMQNGYGDQVFSAMFDAVSIITTTGITHDPKAGIALPFELILLVVFIGGCSLSTAGGLKVFRLVTMLRLVNNELTRLVHPSAVLHEDAAYDPAQREIAKAVWSAFFLAILTLTVALLAFAIQGYMLPEAFALATGAFSQVGNLVAFGLEGQELAAASDATLLTIAALATIARIEILVLLAAFAGNRW